MLVSFFFWEWKQPVRLTLTCIYLVRGLDFMKEELYSEAIAHTVTPMFIRLCVWNEYDRSNLMASGWKCIVMLASYLGKTCTDAFLSDLSGTKLFLFTLQSHPRSSFNWSGFFPAQKKTYFCQTCSSYNYNRREQANPSQHKHAHVGPVLALTVREGHCLTCPASWCLETYASHFLPLSWANVA